ncbi:MAG: L-ribulose-5-phosphate 4-epimerase AraD [Ignavibacteriales bacterium]|nr:L-ribulose-5-phosphate 4-epimerase AraD [Ignavibacteriales bacterium]
MSSLKELKERVWRCNKDLPQLGLVIRAFGNVSGIDREKGFVAIKPSGVMYDDLTVDNIVVVDLEDKIVEGKLRPSSDTKTHTYLYRAFPEIGGVVHTHSTYAVAWAQAMKPIPIMGTTHADLLATDVPCTDLMSDEMIQGDYERETGKQIANAFAARSYKETPMVLVAGHGPFTWGDSPEKALYHSQMLEELAKMAALTLQINPSTPRLKKTLVDKHFKRKHGPDSYYGQE